MEAGFYSIQMWHKIFEIVFAGILVFLACVCALRAFAVVTYKIAHRKSKKTKQKKAHKRVQNKTEIIFDLGNTKDMYLFETIQEKNKMKKELFGNVF